MQKIVFRLLRETKPNEFEEKTSQRAKNGKKSARSFHWRLEFISIVAIRNQAHLSLVSVR